jgi:hypothetical protein
VANGHTTVVEAKEQAAEALGEKVPPREEIFLLPSDENNKGRLLEQPRRGKESPTIYFRSNPDSRASKQDVERCCDNQENVTSDFAADSETLLANFKLIDLTLKFPAFENITT